MVKILEFKRPEKPKEEVPTQTEKPKQEVSMKTEKPKDFNQKLTPEQERDFNIKYLWVIKKLKELKERNSFLIKPGNVQKRRDELLEGSSMTYLKWIILKIIDELKIDSDPAYCEAVVCKIEAEREKRRKQKEEQQRYKAMEWSAKKLYNPELPYHNFDHALYAIAVGKQICYQCKKEGIEINEEVVVAALLFHDSGYDQDFEAEGFESKETYSAYLATKALKALRFDDQFIGKVSRAIISTQNDKPFVSNEEKAVRAADLAGLAATYELFLENNKKLKQENEMLLRREISDSEWKEKTKSLISFYLSQDIHLTKGYEDKDGQSLFHKTAKANLERFLSEN